MVVTCPDLGQGREIWPAVPLILGTCHAAGDRGQHWSRNGVSLRSVPCASPFPSFHFCRRVWRVAPRQTSGARTLYFKIIYCRITGVLVQGDTSPEQKLLFEMQGREGAGKKYLCCCCGKRRATYGSSPNASFQLCVSPGGNSELAASSHRGTD